MTEEDNIEEINEKLVDKWTIDEVVNWAEKIVDAGEASKLRTNKVNGNALLSSTFDELRSLGILFGPAKNLIDGIKKLKGPTQVDKSQTLWEDNNEECKHYYIYEFNKNSIITPFGQWLNTTKNPLYMRESYVGILHEVEKCRNGKEHKGTLITGCPGIGKSYFLNYCVSYYLKQNLRVLFQSASRNRFIFFRNSNEIFKIPRSSSHLPKVDVYVVDAGNPQWVPEPEIFSTTFTIVAASPEETHFKEFLQLSTIKTLHMPIWSIEELSNYNSALAVLRKEQLENINILSEKELADRFDCVGGIPRYIFASESSYVEQKRKYELAVTVCSINNINEYIGTSRLIEISHRIFQYDVSTDFQTTRHKFSSQYVSDQLPSMLEYKEKQGLVILVNRTLANIPSAASLRGVLFESLSHSSLKVGGTFTVRPARDISFDLPCSSEKVVPMKQSLFNIELFTGNYYRPEAKNNKGYDSYVLKIDGNVKTLLAFQMTVSTTHSFSIDFADNLLGSSGADKMDVFFVVPSDVFLHFTLPEIRCYDGRITVNVLEMIVS